MSRKQPQHYENFLFHISILGLVLASRIFFISSITSYFSSVQLETQGTVVIEPWCTNNQTDVICHFRKTIHNHPVNNSIANNNEKAVIVDASRQQAAIIPLFTVTRAVRSFHTGLRDRLHRDRRLRSNIVDNDNNIEDHHATTSSQCHSSFPWRRQKRSHAMTPPAFHPLVASSLYSKPTFLGTSLHEAQLMVHTAVSTDGHIILS